ncbi:MAG: hypothetical protein M1153_02585 [Patescibacteria group bacterium]|nr:hypothetical protein [Patescibacteria group bacterium]
MFKRVTAALLLVFTLALFPGRVFAADMPGTIVGGLTNGPTGNPATAIEYAGVTGTGSVTDQNCTSLVSSLPSYIGMVAGGLLEFVSADTVAGFIQKWTGFGEGLTQINDLLVRHYSRAIIWGVIATAIIAVVGPVLRFVLYLNTTIIDTPTVHSIYTVLLSLVNIGFVIALIIIAFATMFRNDKYGYRKNLPKLLAAALLINFGFFFASVILQAGDTVTHVFADAVSGTPYVAGSADIPQNFGTEATLLNRYNVATITCSISSLTSSFAQGSTGGTNIVESAFLYLAKPLISVSFGGIITLAWAAALMAITIVFLARYAFLIFLLAIMPLSWLGLILPGIKIPLVGGKSNAFEGWWGQFINWVLVGPLLLFLLYISHLLSDALLSPTSSTSASMLVTDSQLVIQLIAILIVNIIGLYAAVKMSGAAGTIAVAATGGALGWMAQGVTNWSGALSARAKLRSEAWEKSSQENKNKFVGGLQFAGARFLGTASKTLSGVALPPQYRTAFERAGVKIPQTKEFDINKAIDEHKKRLQTQLPDAVLGMARAKINARNVPLIRNAVESAAILSYLIDRKQLDKLDTDQTLVLLKSAASIGAQKDALSVRPDLAVLLEGNKSEIDPKSDVKKNTDNILKGYMGSIGKAVDRIKPGQAENLSIQSLTRTIPSGQKLSLESDLQSFEAVTLSLSNSQVARILREGSSEQQKTLVENIKMLSGERGDALIKKYEAYPDVVKEIDRQRKRLAEYIGGTGEEEEEAQQPQQGGEPTIFGPHGEVLGNGGQPPQQPKKGRRRGGGNPDFRALWNSIEPPKIS